MRNPLGGLPVPRFFVAKVARSVDGVSLPAGFASRDVAALGGLVIIPTVAQRVCEFGFPGVLRDRLVAAVLAGSKTATCALRAEWEVEGEQLPLPGARETVIDSAGRPVATIEIVRVEVIRLADASDRLAVAEGEDYTTVAGWRAEHERFWRDEVLPAWPTGTPPSIGEDTEVVVQWFRLVDPEPSDAR